MPLKKHKPEEIIGKLREAEIVLAQGGSAARRRLAGLRPASRPILVAERIWRSEDGPGATDEGP